MKINHNSAKAIRFQFAQCDLPKWSDAGIPIHIVELADGRLEVMIAITGNFSETEQRAALVLARQWRRRLEETQGTRLSDEDRQIGVLRDRWSKMRHDGKTWKEIAGSINHEVEELVLWLASLRDGSPDDLPGNYLDMKFTLWTYLKASGLKDSEADEVGVIGFDNIDHGLPTFDTLHPPVDWRQLRQTIKDHRKRIGVQPTRRGKT